MPVAKPTNLPRWADTVPANRVEPTSGKKDVGWVPGEKPPAQYKNWLLYTIYQWCEWLNDITNQALIWAANHSFNEGASFSRTSANTNAVTATGNGTGRGITSTGGGASGDGGRFVGGAPNGKAIVAVGTGAGVGLDATGGATNAAGVVGTGTGTATGIGGTGGATSGPGVTGTGGAPNGVGVSGTGSGTGSGASGVGGAVSGAGVSGKGGGPNGVGVLAEGTGAGVGLQAVALGAGAAVDATAGTGLAIKATGSIETTVNATIGNSAFIGRKASGTTLPTPSRTESEYTHGQPLFCKYTWQLIMGTYEILFENGDGVYAVDRIADGDAWITWQIVPANLGDAQRRSGFAISSNIAIDHALVVDRDNGGAGGRLRFRVQTLDNTDTAIVASTEAFLFPG